MKTKKKGNKVIMYADQDFTCPGRKVMKVTDNGNGFTVKAYSWSSCDADKYWSIGYADASDLVDCLKLMEYT